MYNNMRTNGIDQILYVIIANAVLDIKLKVCFIHLNIIWLQEIEIYTSCEWTSSSVAPKILEV